MSKKPRYRKVSCRMWTGSVDFIGLSVFAKLAWLYLVTGPQTESLPGLYTLGHRRMAEDIGLSDDDAAAALREIETAGMIKTDTRLKLVWVPKALEHNQPESANVVRSWGRAWELLPQCALLDEARESFRSTLAAMGDSYADAFGEALGERTPKPSPNPSGKASPKPLVMPSAKASPMPEQSLDLPPSIGMTKSGTGAGTGTGAEVGSAGEPAPAAAPLSDLAEEILTVAVGLKLPVDAEFANALALVAERSGRAKLVAKALDEAAGALVAREGVQTTTQRRDLIQRFVRNVRPEAPVSGNGGGRGSGSASGGRYGPSGREEPHNPFQPPTEAELRAAGVIQ